jgi:hypothetical protein
MKNDKTVFIGVPSYSGEVDYRVTNSLMRATSKTRYSINYANSSLLAFTFNQLWCMALNERAQGENPPTHFLMVHSDVVPQFDFLDRMLEIMERDRADVLSVVLPIKNPFGLTSTAIDSDDWEPSRFTMTQIFKMFGDGPIKTFTHPRLLINTGLMLVDFRQHWVDKVRFTIADRIVKVNGVYKPQAQPEDWTFSRNAKEFGARLFATTEVRADHLGLGIFPNNTAWGKWEIDQSYGEAKI